MFCNDVYFQIERGVGVITLDRPNALNSLTPTMVNLIYDTLIKWQYDSKIIAVVICSSSKNCFCAGGDVKLLYNNKDNLSVQMKFFADEYRLNLLIGSYSKPYIALLSGITMGGGVGISLHSQYSIAFDNFLFAMPETAIGFFPDTGVCHILNKLPDKWRIAIAVYAERVNCELSYQLGLVQYLAGDREIESFKEELIDNIKNIDFFLKQHTIKYKYDNHQKCEIKQHYVSNNSPLSMAVTKRQLQLSAGKELVDCLRLDFNIAKNFMRHSDFYEGVRAMLIDKDKNPRWEYLNEDFISDQVVNSYFSEY